MPAMLVATKLLKISYMEMLYESNRSEPRLNRLLGHVSIYDNVNRWCTENAEKLSHFEERIKRQKAQSTLKSTLECPKNTNQSHSVKIRKLAEFQATICAHTEAETQKTVITEDILSKSDSEDEFDSEETLGDDSGDDSTWNDDEDPFIDLIERDKESLLLQGASDDETLELTMLKMFPGQKTSNDDER